MTIPPNHSVAYKPHVVKRHFHQSWKKHCRFRQCSFTRFGSHPLNTIILYNNYFLPSRTKSCHELPKNAFFCQSCQTIDFGICMWYNFYFFKIQYVNFSAFLFLVKFYFPACGIKTSAFLFYPGWSLSNLLFSFIFRFHFNLPRSHRKFFSNMLGIA